MGWNPKSVHQLSLLHEKDFFMQGQGGLFWMEVAQHQQWRKCNYGEGVSNLPSRTMWGLSLKLR